MSYKFYGEFDPPPDKILYEAYFKIKKGGFFVEAGALDGKLFSNCLFFEKYRGWHGINIEPDPVLFKQLAENRPGSKNLNIALWSTTCRRELYASKVVGHASLKPELMVSEAERRIEVLCLPWDIVVQTGEHVDLLSLDVEGAELDVISGMSRSLPDVICVEHPQSGLENLKRVLRDLINESEGSFGYTLDKLTPHNAFFVKKKC